MPARSHAARLIALAADRPAALLDNPREDFLVGAAGERAGPRRDLLAQPEEAQRLARVERVVLARRDDVGVEAEEHLVTLLQVVVDLGLGVVDPDGLVAKQPVDDAQRHILEDALHELVDTLACLVLGHSKGLHEARS